ncbi:hypothetical protein V500_11038 [Pseudogymnoascus sp. VKM F-4518 (FW-2643)]|nr:hypothetical protein V500_11038 [Pseudogymnoascus sp. VKM F-4518 (FW-2643)]
MCSRGPSPSHAAEFCGSNEGLLHIGPGCIVWLPQGYRPRQGSTLREPPEGAFGHPILVLSVTVTDAKNAIIHFATLTSFTNQRWDSGNDIIDISKPCYQNRYVKISPYFLDKKKTTITPPPLTLEHRQEKKFHLRQTSFVDLGASTARSWRIYCAAIRVRDDALKVSATTMASARSRMDRLALLILRLPRTIDSIGAAPSSQLGVCPHPCCIGRGAAWTSVPTEQLRNDFVKCTIRARCDALKEFATIMASAGNIIDHLMLLILRLPRTIDLIGTASSSQLGVSPHHLLLHCAGLAAALATLEETTTTGTHTIAITCMLYAAMIMISRRLSPLPTCRLSVRLGQGARKHRLVNPVGAEVMGDATLLTSVVLIGFAAKKSAEARESVEARESPVQAATASMAAGMSGLGGQDEGGWTTVSYTKRRR